ncbi:MAG: peptidase U32 family protein [Anaerovoracaceae bacterium]
MANNSIPELLSPAGGFTQLKAAVQNGADAVYMGGPLFNARIKAENFTHDDMKRAIEYAHERNTKVYITLNTLIKDSELSKAFSYVNFLYGAGADGIIIQDMGIGRLIRKYLPDMPMHLSTQGTVYNEWAVDTAKDLGFCRIVPARELSLKEIKRMAQVCHSGKHSCEIEIFIHGALCMCYSGQCQMSRILGGINGRSGNRGLCAQPCRLPYESDSGKKGYILSPKDICTLNRIPALCEAGVDSFKIEGRLKSPQYVAVVTSVYRKYLDMYKQKGHVNVSDEDMEELRQIFNRGGFSEGYLFGNPGSSILSGSSPKNMGVYIGSVKTPQRSTKGKTGTLIDVKCSGKLSIGDGIEIRGKGHSGNIVSYLKRISDDCLRIGDIKDKVFPGDKIYKVTDKELIRKAENSYAKDHVKKVSVNLSFRAVIGKRPKLTVSEFKTGISVETEGEAVTEAALNKAADKERISAQLGKLGGTPLTALNIEGDVEDGAAISVSSVNMMRRKAAEKLLEEKRRVKRSELSQKRMDEIRESETLGEDIKSESDSCKKYRIYNEEQLSDLLIDEKYKIHLVYMPVEIYMENGGNILKKLVGEHKSAKEIKIIPYILNVSKGNLDSYIEKNFEKIAEAVRETGILIGNLGWIKKFEEAGVQVLGDYGLNVCNRQSAKAFAEIGMEIKELSHEMSSDAERIPLMITEHKISGSFITDRKGVKYKIIKSASGDKWLVFTE